MIIESGVANGSRLAVFDDRIREHEVQQSATNYISTAQLGGRTGTFTVTNRFATGSFVNNSSFTIISITNDDPINLLVIDRAFVQIFSSSITLPNSGLSLAIDNISGGVTILSKTNENKFSRIIPNVTVRNQVSTVLSPIRFINVPRIFPILGDIEELIPQGLDTIIIPWTGVNASQIINNNTISMSIFNSTGGGVTIGFNTFIKFMMVPPDQLG